MEKRKILVICTGGTIASRQTANGLSPAIGPEELLSYIPETTEKFDVDAIEICRVDSTNITAKHWTKMVQTIKAHYFDYDGFVICHGTDTMAYTSAALSYMIRFSPRPIVITGAQKPIDLGITDAKTNLSDAILYAADPESSGVSIVFGGNVIAGTRAKKTRARSYNAFSSVNFPNLAVILDGKILRYIHPEPFRTPVSFTENMSENVFVLKLIPGIRPEILGYLFRHYDAIIIESFGLGGIPSSMLDEFYSQMNHWMKEGKILVMATQVVNEGSNMEIYEVGNKVKADFQLIEAYDMTLEATITKLMYLMSVYGHDYSRIREEFYRTINYDILYTQ